MKYLDPNTRLLLSLLFLALVLLAWLEAGIFLHNLFNQDAVLDLHPLLLLSTLSTPGVLPGLVPYLFIAGFIILVLVVGGFVWAMAKPSKAGIASKKGASGKELVRFHKKSAAKRARGFGFDLEDGEKQLAGLPIGRAAAGGEWLYTSFEDVCLVLAGPRSGKTTTFVVPRIIAAPGPVIATSNKRDVVDDTIWARLGKKNAATWVFDPQGIWHGHRQEFWWDPLKCIKTPQDASYMAKVFADAARNGQESKSDPFWSTSAQSLVGSLILAAKLKQGTLLDVFKWISDSTDNEPFYILNDAGETRSAQEFQGIYNTADVTKKGIYANAQTVVGFMRSAKAMRWVTPQAGLPEFQIEDFINSKWDTLYCLSREGKDQASPIVSALTVFTVDAALLLAESRPTGRLPRPMLIELDEAANVCPWHDLPALYSHLGSRSLVVDTILQSWTQGKNVWGENGMEALWSASNARIYLGSNSEASFLTNLSRLIGNYYKDSQSVSSSNSGVSVSVGEKSQQMEIQSVSDLGALKAGTAWLLPSQAKPALVQMVPWYRGKIQRQRCQWVKSQLDSVWGSGPIHRARPRKLAGWGEFYGEALERALEVQKRVKHGRGKS